MKLLCAFQSIETYNRLQQSLPYPLLEWSHNLESEADLQQLLQADRYDLLILDLSLWWSQEASELARKHGIEVALYYGELRDVANLIVRRIAPLLEAREEPIEPLKPRISPEDDEGKGPVRIIEKEKIVEVEKIIEKEKIVERQVKVAVPVHSYVSMQSKLCMTISLTPRAGSTFLATSLATSVATRSLHCTLIEHPTNRVNLYDHLNVAEFKPDYRPPLEVLDYGVLKKESEFLYQGIAMYVNHPRYHYEEVEAEELTKLLYQLRYSPFIFYDASFHEESLYPELFSEFDHIFLVIDPEPVLLQRLLEPESGQATEEYHLLRQLLAGDERGEYELHIVVNRNNSGVDQKLLAECLPKKPLTYLPALPAKQMYQAAWEARLIEIEDELDDSLMPILRLIVPENFLNPSQDDAKGGKWLGRLFSKK